MEILKNPDRVALTKKGRKIAQGKISETHVLRVIFEERDDSIEVITFYPGRRKRYED